MPMEPDVHVCAPVLIFAEDGHSILMDSSYAFCVLRKDPSDESKYKRIPLAEFLKDRPRMIDSKDASKLDFWEKDLLVWGKKNCNGK